MSSVIGYVLKLCNKKPYNLPSVSTINNWSVERAVIARRHIFQKLVRKKIQLYTLTKHQNMALNGVHLPLETQKVTICS